MEVIKLSQNEYKFIFASSTHTIGNILQKELLRDPNVTFGAYLSPHPLETKMIVSIITSGKNPREVMVNAFNNLIAKLDELKSQTE